MQLQPYVTQVQTQLMAAAALGGDPVRDLAEALTAAADPAVRLAMLGAVSAATEELTAALLDVPGAPSVSVRMHGDELQIEARTWEVVEPVLETAPAGDEADSARISLRLSETLKDQIEAAARSKGVSVNSWIQRAASAALADTGPRRRAHSADGVPSGARVTGWING